MTDFLVVSVVRLSGLDFTIGQLEFSPLVVQYCVVGNRALDVRASMPPSGLPSIRIGGTSGEAQNIVQSISLNSCKVVFFLIRLTGLV